MSQNTWTFDGVIEDVSVRNLASGKSLVNIVASAADGQYKRLCVCTKFGGVASDVIKGSIVTMTGRIDGREYQGKHYAGLTCYKIEVHGVDTKDAQPPLTTNSQSENKLSGDDEQLPF